jgi:hypothetical protein
LISSCASPASWQADPSSSTPPSFARAGSERTTAAALCAIGDDELFERVDGIVTRLTEESNVTSSGGPKVAAFLTVGVLLRIRTRLEKLLPGRAPRNGWGRQAAIARVAADMTALPVLPPGDGDTQKAGNNLCSYLDRKKKKIDQIKQGGSSVDERTREVEESWYEIEWLGTPTASRRSATRSPSRRCAAASRAS